MGAKTGLVRGLIGIFLTLFLIGVPVSASANTGHSQMQNLLVDISDTVTTLTNEGYSVANIYMDRLTLDTSYQMSRTLYEGHDYVIVGIGGDGVRDLDLRLYNILGTLVGEDDSIDNLPLLTVTPGSDAVYSVETDVYAVNSNVRSGDELFFATIIAFKA